MNADSSGVAVGAAQRHEFWVSDDAEDAVRKTKIVLRRLGELTKVEPGLYVEGAIKFGMYNAALRITWRSEAEAALMAKAPGAGATSVAPGAMLGTVLVLEADCLGARDAATRETAAKSSIERFEEAYHHFDDPDFKPDRLGLLPMTVIGVIVCLVLIGYAILHTPFMQKMLPKKALTITAPSPGTEPSPSPDASPGDGSGEAASTQ